MAAPPVTKTRATTVLAVLFAVLALALLPWTIAISIELPERQLSEHWDLAWTGFDVGLAASFFLTAYAAWKRRDWLQRAAAVAGTLLLCDAWFDVVTSPTGGELQVAILLALLAELPVAALCFGVAIYGIDWWGELVRRVASARRRGPRA